MKKLLSIAVLIAIASLSFANGSTYHRCGSMEALEALKKSDPGLEFRMQQIEQQTATFIAANKKNQNSTQSVITIPVVFHVVYNTSAQNISDAQAQAQINQLNLDFARLNSDAGNTPAAFSGLAVNTGVQFCLAVRDPNGNATTGIERRQTSTTSFSTNDNIKRYANGGWDAWPASSYLNIWSGNLSGGVLGYAQFPGGSSTTDGVVLLYSSIGSMTQPGTASPYNLGRTATHEVGHWLNLYHIWGDDGTSCSGSDNVSDTPNQAGENYGCPAYPRTDACSPSSPGVMFMNYMDYTDDACMNMFTSGQSSRMNALFGTGGSRVGLLSSLGCVPPTGGGTCSTPSGQSTTGITTSAATLNWSAVSGAASYNVQYRVNGTSNWTSTTSATNSKSLSGLTSNTTYEWQVQTVCSGSSSSFSSSATFTTLSSTSCTDPYESNNSSSAAKTIAKNTDITALIGSSSDNDWFKFSTTSPNTKVKITLTNLPADYDVRLYNSSLSQLGIGQNGGTASETIIYNTTTARTYYVRVYGYNGAYSTTQCYTLRASVSSTNFREMDESEIEITPAANSVFVYPNPANGNVTVASESPDVSPATAVLYDLMGKMVKSYQYSLETGFNKTNLDISGISSGIYILEVTTSEMRQSKRLVIE